MRRKLYLLMAVLMVLGALAAWGWTSRGVDSTAVSLAVFNIDNLSCGSCVRNIQNALDRVDGVGKVEVSVTAGRGEVEFDQQRIAADEIARRITAAGYPARLREALTAADYQALKAESGQLAAVYVARIGDRLLPRQEFEAVVRQRQEQLPQPSDAAALQDLRLQVWDELQQRELLLGAAEAENVVVQDGEVALEIEKLKATHAGLDGLIQKQFDSQEAFARQIKNNLIISRHLDQHVAASSLPEPQRQQALQQWYRQLVDTTRVVIFDPAIKAASSAGGAGCGGSCCG